MKYMHKIRHGIAFFSASVYYSLKFQLVPGEYSTPKISYIGAT